MVHILNRPINDQPTKSLDSKTEYTPRAVERLINIYLTIFIYDLTVKQEWKVAWLDPKRSGFNVSKQSIAKAKNMNN